MDIEKGWIVALIFLVVVGGANLLMYAVVRGAFRNNDKNMFKKFTESFAAPQKKKEGEFEELSRRVRELRGVQSEEDEKNA